MRDKGRKGERKEKGLESQNTFTAMGYVDHVEDGGGTKGKVSFWYSSESLCWLVIFTVSNIKPREIR